LNVRRKKRVIRVPEMTQRTYWLGQSGSGKTILPIKKNQKKKTGRKRADLYPDSGQKEARKDQRRFRRTIQEGGNRERT